MKYLFLFKQIFLIAVCIVLFQSCNKSKTPLEASSPYQYRVPPQTNDGWQTGSLDEVGISKEILINLMEDIRGGEYRDIHSILIVKDGKLVFEEYFDGYAYDWSSEQFRGRFVEFDMNTLHNIHSVTKSITSGVLGIAIDKSFIQSVDEKVFDFFPEYSHLKNQEKEQITLKHLLTMTCGLGWNENDVPPGDMNNDVVQLFIVTDPIEYVLAKPVVSDPGTNFYYHSGGVNVLGEVIKKATGLRMDSFCQQHLFTPLGITEFEWNFIKPGIVFSSGDLRLRPRDIAKFGYLYLNGGMWNSQRIISEEWIEASYQEQYSFQGDNWFGYGYLWWLRKDSVQSATVHSYHALGWGGQRSIVFPELSMVVVFTGGNYITSTPVDEIMVQYILPSVSYQ